jgi:hypothetical protein
MVQPSKALSPSHSFATSTQPAADSAVDAPRGKTTPDDAANSTPNAKASSDKAELVRSKFETRKAVQKRIRSRSKTKPKPEAKKPADPNTPAEAETTPKSMKPADSKTPTDADPTPENPPNEHMVLGQVLSSLKQLEKNYASLSAGIHKLHNGKTAGKDASPPDEGAPKTVPEAAVAKKELKAKMKKITATLDVLKNVLHSQNIPIDGLRQNNKPRTKKGPPQPRPNKKPKPPVVPGVFEAVFQPPPEPVTAPSEPVPAPSEPVSTSPAPTPTPFIQTPPTPAPQKSVSKEFLNAKAVAAALAARVTKTAPATKPAKAKTDPSASRKPMDKVKVDTLNPHSVQLTPVEQPTMPPVAKLAYGLDRVLFNPGVYMLQDPRSKVYNFDPYLSKIMPLNEFDFGALQRYVTSSKDSTLNQLAAKLGKKYSGSTSSMTSMLGHFHFLISNWRPVSSRHLSKSFPLDYTSFNLISRAPAATFLHLRDGVYSIDADKEHDSANILSMLGKSMEKLLTLNKDDFERYRHANSAQITEEERNAAEAYHFSTLGDFLMRSQLDATDPRLPGTGMFDLKTRAVISIRMDAAGFQKGLGYEIRNRFGEWESFEREYFDMIRSAFLKYSLQVRMGRMDGIYVAFHNTERIFGFQYIPLSEMDQALHGTTGESTALGDQEFKLSLQLLNKVLDRATERFPGRNIRLHVETRPGNPPWMYVFAKPVTPAEIEKVQTANQAAIAQFENKFLGLQKEGEAELEAESDAQQTTTTEDDTQVSNSNEEAAKQDPYEYWEEMREKVEEAVEDDARGISHVRDAIQEALEQSGLLHAKSPAEARVHVSNLLDALVRRDAQDSSRQEVDAATEETASVEEAKEESPAQDTSSETTSAAPTQPSTTESTRASSGSLKDLIVKAAERLDERLDDNGALIGDDDASSTSQLRDFECILSELIADRSDLDPEASHAEEEVESDRPLPVEQAKELIAGATEKTGTEMGPETDTTLSVDGDEILGMHVMVRNLINRKYVDRAPARSFGASHKWTVEYSIEEIGTDRAKTLYASIQARRKKAFENGDQDRRDSNWRQMFKGRLEQLSKSGRQYRAREEAKAAGKPVYTAESEEPISHEEAFAQHRQWKELDLKE